MREEKERESLVCNSFAGGGGESERERGRKLGTLSKNRNEKWDFIMEINVRNSFC